MPPTRDAVRLCIWGFACLLASCAGSGGGGGGGTPKPACKPPAGGATISFKGVIQPIFNRSCAFSPSCHAGPAPSQGNDLSPGKACASSINVKATEVPTLKRVKPGDPANSYLVQKIQGPVVSGVLMPQGCPGPPVDSRAQCLTPDEIQAIVQWVTECAPCNN